MRKYIIALLVSLVAGGAFSQVVFQEGFETPEVTNESNYNRYVVQQNVSFENAWEVQNVDLFEDDDGTWRGEAKEGDQYIDLACSVNGYISTTALLDAGEYKVSFWLAGNFFGGNDADKSVDVYLDLEFDSDPATFSATKTGQSTIVTADEWIFVQSSSFTVSQAQNLILTFDDTSADTDPWAGAFIDDVRIVAVPEPATVSLMVIAGIGLIFRRRFSRF